MVDLYRGDAYPIEVRAKLQHMPHLAIEIANRWMLGWPNEVAQLIKSGDYLKALVNQEQEERRVLCSPGNSHLARHEIVQEYGLSLRPPTPSPEAFDHDDKTKSIRESKVCAEHVEKSIEDLIDLAEMDFVLKDDAAPHFASGINSVNAELKRLIGYRAFQDKFKSPLPSVPTDPAWVAGKSDTVECKWLRLNYPGIVEYFDWAEHFPHPSFWGYVARLGNWQILAGCGNTQRAQLRC